MLDLQKFNRAVEVYATQLMPVSEIGLREGLRAFGAMTPQQVVIWEQLMDARTVLLTANTETATAHAGLSSLGASRSTPYCAAPRPPSTSFADGALTGFMVLTLTSVGGGAAQERLERGPQALEICGREAIGRKGYLRRLAMGLEIGTMDSPRR